VEARRTFVGPLPCALLLGLLLALPSCIAEAAIPVDEAIASLRGLPFDAFVETSYRHLVLRDPDTLWGMALASEYGLERYDQWADLSSEAFAETGRLEAAILDILREVDIDALTDAQRITFEAYNWLLEDRIARSGFPFWDFPIGPLSYGVQNLALELLQGLPIDSIEHAADYVARLREVDRWMDHLLTALRAREAHGVVPTQLAIDLALAELDETFPPESEGGCDPEALGVYVSFVERLDQLQGLDEGSSAAFLNDARDAIEASLIPAYRSLRSYVSSLDGRAGPVGVFGVDRGVEYYQILLQHHVTKAITPEEIFQLGEREVARLQEEMRAFATGVLGWPSGLTMAALDRRLTTANVPVLEGIPLLEEYDRLIAAAHEKLGTAFDVLPESPLVITVDRSGPPAYYREPPIDKSGPGQIVTSLVSIVPYTAYDEPVLMHHEGVPGHHLQLALARDLDLPRFRRDLIGSVYTRHPTFQAFVEGWALYAERLAAEIGLYEEDPIGFLCRLRLELVRAARLVVDVGLNALGWTWSEAAKYLAEATGRTESTMTSIRYASYPGQACAYNVGFFTFLELRERAVEALGDAFDLKEFHHVVLMNGAIPLGLLEKIVDTWIAENLRG